MQVFCLKFGLFIKGKSSINPFRSSKIWMFWLILNHCETFQPKATNLQGKKMFTSYFGEW